MISANKTKQHKSRAVFFMLLTEGEYSNFFHASLLSELPPSLHVSGL